MKRSSWRQIIACGTLGASACAAALALSAQGCSSSSSGPANTGSSSGGNTSQLSCTNPTLTLAFDPAYAFYIPNSMHTFQVPFGVLDLASSVQVQWGANNPSLVSISPGSVDFGMGNQSYANAMVTTQGTGDVIIVAVAGNQCGTTKLTIESATDDDWTIGNERYNNGITLEQVRPGQIARIDGGDQAACTNCHGPTATDKSFTTVAHTPQQTAGFSDSDLIGIFTMGMIPPGGYFDDSVVSQNQWAQFHQWAMSSDQANAMVVYLRSLPPGPQTGMPNFPPRMRPDGGYGGRDGGRRDGGGMTGGDSGSGDDSSTAPETSTGDDSSTGQPDAPSQGDDGSAE